MQRYVLYTVLNGLARLLALASTQNLCRFIHGVSYSTCMVISTFIATHCPCLTSHSKGLFANHLESTYTFKVFFCTLFNFPFLYAFAYVYTCMFVYTHSTIHQGRQVDRLSVHCDLHTNSFLHEHYLQFGFSALPSLTAEVRQCGRHTVSIPCLNSSEH